MDIQKIQQYKSSFDSIAREIKDVWTPSGKRKGGVSRDGDTFKLTMNDEQN